MVVAAFSAYLVSQARAEWAARPAAVVAQAFATAVLGFRRRLAGLRVAGLGVAAVAVAEVLFSDLASLDAFYRIGSVFILGIVSLALAWLYHRQARAKTENA